MRTGGTLALSILLCAGCASGPPEWVAGPEVEGGFAATECVRDSGKLSLDRQIALSKARAGVATQLEARARAMDAALARLKDPAAEPAIPGATTPFALVARPVAEQMLPDLEPERVEYVETDDTRQLCAMVAAGPEQTRALFERLVQATGHSLDEATTAALYQEFIGAATQETPE